MRTGTKLSLSVLGGLLLAGGILGVIAYASNIRGCSGCGDTNIAVVVSNQDIPPGTALDPLIEANAFRIISVPMDAVVVGAVVSTDELRGQTALGTIYQNEQIPVARVGKRCHPFEGTRVCLD